MIRITLPIAPGKPRRRRPIATAIGIVIPIAFLLAACVSDRTGSITTPAPPAPRVPAPERGSGNGDHARLVATFGGEVRAPAAHAVLTDITERLVRATDRPDQHYEVTILDSPVANAFALPNGRLYVTRGLLALANDTSEVAGVLAHEISHVTLSHAAARTELALRSTLVTRVVEDVLRDPQAGSELKARSQVAFASFSRSQELEADQVGVRTLVRAGFDPYGAVRFLETLNRNATLRSTALGDKGGAPDMLATHPGTPERIALARDAARRAGSPGIGASDRATYLAAVEGLTYGDNPQDGLVRGRRFLHPRLGVAFEAPEGILLENTARAVVGGSADGSRRLLFDAVEARPGQSLEEVLRSTWNEPLDAVETTSLNGNAAAIGSSRGGEFTFRLAAVRVGGNAFRLILASRPGSDPEPAFRRTLASLRPLGAEEARAVAPVRLAVVTAQPGDTVESFASRMALTERAAERFRVLNGLDRGGPLTPGERYKLVVD